MTQPDVFQLLKKAHECIVSRMAEIDELAECDQAYMVQTELEIRNGIQAIESAPGVKIANPAQKCRELAKLLLEARDALPAITMTAARLRGIDLTLADRIEAALEPWKTTN